jgi:hypothetical protein
MSATLLRVGTRGDIARSAHPYLVISKGTGFVPLMVSCEFDCGVDPPPFHVLDPP